MASPRASYRPQGEALGNTNAAAILAEKRRLEQEDEKQRADNATIAASQAGQRAGYQMPAGSENPKNQSPANQAAIAHSVTVGNNGGHMPPNTPIMQASHMDANSPRMATGLATTGPIYTPGARAVPPPDTTAAAAVIPKPAGVPEAIANTAGTGQTTLTPYGTVRSTTAAPGSAPTPLLAGTDQSLGPQRESPKDYGLRQGANGGVVPSPDAQAELRAKYPAIGQAGTQANADFLKSWKDATANSKTGDTVDHNAIADQVMKNITTPANTGDKAVADAQPAPDIAQPQSVAPNPTTQFAGSTVPATTALKTPDQFDASDAANSAQAAGAKVASALATPVVAAHDAAIAVGNAASSAWNKHVAPFFRGFSGSAAAPAENAPSYSPTPTVDRVASGQGAGALDSQPLTLGGTSSVPAYQPPTIPNDTPNTAGY